MPAGALERNWGPTGRRFRPGSVRAALVFFWLGSWALTARTIIVPCFFSLTRLISTNLGAWVNRRGLFWTSCETIMTMSL